jgi:FkbM family methyltransferase
MTTPIPHYKISFAQNLEDLVLAGVLRGIEGGFYVDVGANHPILDSVTKIFYDKGWSGINIEPNPQLHEELCRQRPRDTNLMIGLGSLPGSLTFRSYDSIDGMSSCSSHAHEYVHSIFPDAPYTDFLIEVSNLSRILDEHRPKGDINFLKIDVEGMELEVLLGNDWSRYRPWVLCIERSRDLARLSAISKFLEISSYSAVFFDGINDFYVADERRQVWESFYYPRDVIMNGVPVNQIFVKCMTEMAAAERR